MAIADRRSVAAGESSMTSEAFHHSVDLSTKNARALLGFMGEQEALNFLKSMCVFGGKTEDELKGVWRTSKSAVDILSPPDLSAEVLDIDDRFRVQLETVAKDPLLPEAVPAEEMVFQTRRNRQNNLLSAVCRY